MSESLKPEAIPNIRDFEAELRTLLDQVREFEENIEAVRESINKRPDLDEVYGLSAVIEDFAQRTKSNT